MGRRLTLPISFPQGLPTNARGDTDALDMKREDRVTSDRYVDVDYHQFTPSAGLRIAMRIAGVLTWPITVPLALLSRTSDFLFRTVSELFALVPFLFGTIVRQEFYRFALRRCGNNVSIGFGTVFIYRDIEIGNNVLIGMHNTVHYCDFGSYVLVAEGCAFLSGAKYHNYETRERPMALLLDSHGVLRVSGHWFGGQQQLRWPYRHWGMVLRGRR